MNNNYMIYCLTNKVNGKRYIGITNNFHRRWSEHQSTDSIIGRAIRKHGNFSFRINVLCSRLSIDVAKCLEGRLIDKMNTLKPNGYNVASGGEGGYARAGFSEAEKAEWSKKVSQANTGKTRTDETKQKLSDSQKGKTLSQEARKKLSDFNKGRKHTEQARKKMSEAMKGNKNSLGHNHSSESRQKMSDLQIGENNSMSCTNRDKRRGQLRLF